MKIGILTYHRAENYGALLQAYALKTYLQSLGHDVSFVDYWPKYHSNYFSLFSWQKFKQVSFKWKMIMLINATIWLFPRYLRKHRLQGFMREKLGLSEKPLYTNDDNKTEKYDLVVYGSDQIWRKQNLGGMLFDSWYFGSENINAIKKIAYAGSMGTVETTAQDDEYIKTMLENFDEISVRETDLQLYLNDIGVSSTLVIDPVFLLSKEQWRSIERKSDENEKYILFYNLLNTPESKSFAHLLSKETGLSIREVTKKINFSHIGKRYICSASVERFLQLIDGAEYVVSNSFHGVAMAMMFEKQFYAVGMGKKSNRIKSLLQSLGIEGRYIDTFYDAKFGQMIDYQEANARILCLTDKSRSYLIQSMR